MLHILVFLYSNLVGMNIISPGDYYVRFCCRCATSN